MPDMKLVLCGANRPTSFSGVSIAAAAELTGKSIPRFLHLPTAKYSQAGYDSEVALVREIAEVLGLKYRVLHAFGEMPSAEQAAEIIGESDLGYFGGGYTKYAHEQIKPIAHVLKEAVLSGRLALSGGSAGMIIWFDSGHTDGEFYEKPEGAPDDYVWKYSVHKPLLGLLPGLGCPHADSTHPETGRLRLDCLKEALPRQESVAIAADNRVSLRIVGDTASVLLYNGDNDGCIGEHLHRLTTSDGGKVAHERIHPSDGEFRLSELLAA